MLPHLDRPAPGGVRGRDGEWLDLVGDHALEAVGMTGLEAAGHRTQQRALAARRDEALFERRVVEPAYERREGAPTRPRGERPQRARADLRRRRSPAGVPAISARSFAASPSPNAWPLAWRARSLSEHALSGLEVAGPAAAKQRACEIDACPRAQEIDLALVGRGDGGVQLLGGGCVASREHLQAPDHELGRVAEIHARTGREALAPEPLEQRPDPFAGALMTDLGGRVGGDDKRDRELPSRPRSVSKSLSRAWSIAAHAASRSPFIACSQSTNACIVPQSLATATDRNPARAAPSPL